MKTLSIQQPWASLICAGIKDVENRTWKAAKVPGRILIHASSKKVTKNFFAGIPEEMQSYISNHVFYGNIPHLDDLPTSAIIGYVDVVGFDAGYTGSVWDGGPQQIKWKLDNAWLFDEPILNVKGKLNLFDYDLDENNLPPAHKVMLRQVSVDGSELVIPTTDANIEDIVREGDEYIDIFVQQDNISILCKNTNEGFVYKPQTTVRLEGESQSVRFELRKESGICWIPDPSDESKPLEIEYHDGSWGQWQILQLALGNKL